MKTHPTQHRFGLSKIMGHFTCMAVLTSAVCLTATASAHAAGLYQAITMPSLAAGLGEPSDMAIALDGEMFVADSANGRVAVVKSGRVVRDWDGSEGAGPELRQPTGICIGPDDLVYVADAGADAVMVYQRSGIWVRTIGGSGTADGRFLGPSDVIADATGIWVADTYNDRVQRLSLSGSWMKTVGGGTTAMFMQPVSLDLYNGLVYVAEATGLRGQAFNATTYAVAIQPWGISDSGGGTYVSRYLRPAGIDVDASARLLFTDGGRGVIEQMNSTASSVTSLTLGGMTGGLSQPVGIQSINDILYVADGRNDRIARYSFPATAWVDPIKPTGSSDPGAFLDPSGIAPLPDGGFLVADTGADRIQRFDAKGTLVSVFATAGAGAVDAPYGIVVAGEEVFVADSANNRIQVFTTSGSHVRTLGGAGTGAGQFSQPTALAVDGDGNLLVADTNNHRVQRIASQTGAWLQTIAEGGVTNPRGVAVDAAGTVFVADTGGHRIRSFSSTGTAGVSWGVFGPGNGQMSAPQGLSADPVTGEIVVADTGNHRLQVFSATGAFRSVVGVRGTAAGELRAPRGVSVAQGRHIFIADSGNHRIQKLGYDDVAPTTTASGIPPSWVNTPVTVTLDATDTASGVATTYYRIGTGADTTYTAPVTVTNQGTTSFRYWSVDRTGNVEGIKTATIRIDSVPPSGSMVVSNGAALVSTRTVTVNSSVTDAISMSIDSGTGFGTRLAYSATATVTVPADGLRSVTVRYYDALDNMLSLTDTITVDTTAPTVGLSRSPASAATSLAVTVSLAASDAVSGVASRFVSVNGAAEQPYTTALTIDAEGAHTVSARVADAAGNVATASTGFTIDRTGPVAVLNGIAGDQTFTSAAIFSLTASDSFSAVSAILYSLDGAPEVAYTAPVSVSAEGTHTVTYRAVDSLGNVGASGSVRFVVDSSPPIVLETSGVDGTYRSGDTTIALQAADSGTGVAELRYRINGGAFAPYADGFVISGDGDYTIEFDATDGAGNRSELSAVRFVIDSRVPAGSLVAENGAQWVDRTDVTLASAVVPAATMAFDIGAGFGPTIPYAAAHTVVLPGEGVHTITGSYTSLAGLTGQAIARIGVDLTGPTVDATGVTAGSYRATDTTVTIKAVDFLSGVDNIVYRLDGGDPTPYAEPIVVSGDGQHTIEYQAFDIAGNSSALSSLSFTIDSRVPTGDLVVEGGAPYTNRLEVSLRSAVTGAAEMRFDAGTGFTGWMPFAEHHDLTLPGEGAHTIVAEYRSVSGLVGELDTHIVADLTAPTVAVSGVVEGSYRAGDTTVTLDAIDIASGIDRIDYRVDGGSWLTYAAPFVVVGEGPHTVEYRAFDRAANESEPGSLSFTIDSRVPAGELVVADGAPYTDQATVSVRSNVTGATEMRFDFGSGFGEWMPFAEESELTLPTDGVHAIVAEYRSRAGLTTKLPVTIMLDRAAPVLSPARLIPVRLTIAGSAPSVHLRASWAATDPAPASGLAVRSVRIAGRAFTPAVDAQDLGVIAAGTHVLRISARDAAGNMAATKAQVSLGAMPAPAITRTNVRTLRLTVRGHTLKTGETAVFRCYRRAPDGSWRLARTVAARGVVGANGPIVTGSVGASSGTWRYALEVSSATSYRLGTVSAAVRR